MEQVVQILKDINKTLVEIKHEYDRKQDWNCSCLLHEMLLKLSKINAGFKVSSEVPSAEFLEKCILHLEKKKLEPLEKLEIIYKVPESKDFKKHKQSFLNELEIMRGICLRKI